MKLPAHFGFWDWDARSQCLRLSQGLEALCGLPPGSFGGTTEHFMGCVHPDDLAELRLTRQAALDQGCTFEMEFRVVQPDGNLRWVVARGAPIHSEDGVLLGSKGVVIDITDLKQREQLLALHAQVMGNMSEGVAVVRAHTGRIVLANPSFERMLGYVAGELIGAHFSVTHVPAAEGTAPVHEVPVEMHQSGRWQGEFELRRKDGRTFWCRAAISEFDHLVFGRAWVCVGRDITKERRMRRARDEAYADLRRLSANVQEKIEAERSALARDIHDHLGAMLTGIGMKAETLARARAPQAPILQAQLRDIAAMARTALASSRTIVTRLRPPVLDDLGLTAACRWLVEEWSAGAGVYAEGHFAPVRSEPPRALSTDLFRILQELLTNVARHAQARRVEVYLPCSTHDVRLSVRDDGRGGTDPHKPGTYGILGIRERARQHGGTVDVVTGVWGTRVDVELFFAPAASQ